MINKPKNSKPQITAIQSIARTRLFHVEQLSLTFANGVTTQYERLRNQSRGAVLVVPMQDDETVLLIREYAAGVDRYEIGLPKGRIDGDENPLETANRELMEEVGVGARYLQKLTTVTLAPGYMSHQTHIILARDLYPQHLVGDEPEPIEVIAWPLRDLDTLIARPDCTEGRSLLALFMVRAMMFG